MECDDLMVGKEMRRQQAEGPVQIIRQEEMMEDQGNGNNVIPAEAEAEEMADAIIDQDEDPQELSELL